MPNYDYECSNCGHTFERAQSIKAKALKKCPECKKMQLERLIGSAGFILKGGGWFADDYCKPQEGGQ